jgi:hypothetical protein
MERGIDFGWGLIVFVVPVVPVRGRWQWHLSATAGWLDL